MPQFHPAEESILSFFTFCPYYMTGISDFLGIKSTFFQILTHARTCTHLFAYSKFYSQSKLIDYLNNCSTNVKLLIKCNGNCKLVIVVCDIEQYKQKTNDDIYWRRTISMLLHANKIFCFIFFFRLFEVTRIVCMSDTVIMTEIRKTFSINDAWENERERERSNHTLEVDVLIANDASLRELFLEIHIIILIRLKIL